MPYEHPYKGDTNVPYVPEADAGDWYLAIAGGVIVGLLLAAAVFFVMIP